MSAFLAQAPIAWYVVRASGLVAFGALTLSVWLGLAMLVRMPHTSASRRLTTRRVQGSADNNRY